MRDGSESRKLAVPATPAGLRSLRLARRLSRALLGPVGRGRVTFGHAASPGTGPAGCARLRLARRVSRGLLGPVGSGRGYVSATRHRPRRALRACARLRLARRAQPWPPWPGRMRARLRVGHAASPGDGPCGPALGCASRAGLSRGLLGPVGCGRGCVSARGIARRRALRACARLRLARRAQPCSSTKRLKMSLSVTMPTSLPSSTTGSRRSCARASCGRHRPGRRRGSR